MVLSMPISTWSPEVSDRWPEHGPDDVAGPSWAEVVRLAERSGAPLGALDPATGTPLPPSVLALRRGSG